MKNISIRLSWCLLNLNKTVFKKSCFYLFIIMYAKIFNLRYFLSFLWYFFQAKQLADKTKHRSPMLEISSLVPTRSESPSRSTSRPNSEACNNNARLSDPTGAALKRNSTPITSNSPLSILRGSIDTSGSPGKSKGSPVTALKDAIDRGYLTNGNVNPTELATAQGINVQDPEGYLKPQNNNQGEDKVGHYFINMCACLSVVL